MMLSKLGQEQHTLFEGLVENLFTNKKIAVGVMISMYNKEKCLLSDRSFITNFQDPTKLVMDFNLRHDAFIRYFFAPRATLLSPNTHPDLIAMSETLDPVINACYLADDMTQLRNFNMNVINQSYSHVFCAAREGIVY